jgi:hypothetical protein
MLRLLVTLLALVIAPPVDAQPRESSHSAVQPFLGKLFGKQEDFAELKKDRRKLASEIARIERDVRILETTAEKLANQLEDAPLELARLNGSLRSIDRLIAEKSAGPVAGVPPTPSATPNSSSTLFSDEFAFFSKRTIEELRTRKQDLEQRIKDITERQQRLTANREDHRKRRDELDSKQAQLVELEDRISVALSTGSRQYLYRTIVSLIFAMIVAFLVLRFFRIVEQDEEVKRSIFGGDSGIQFVTLFSIVIAVILFGILEILGANELSALLGGLSGYILGKSTPRPQGVSQGQGATSDQ